MSRIYPVILSGGSGTRLWPSSRALYPKQLLSLISERTMLQETALRVTDDALFQKPVIISNEEHRFSIRSQLSDIDIVPAAHILEPVGRNTAPAAIVAALWIAQNDPKGQLLLLPADHHIRERDGLTEAIQKASKAAEDGYLTTFGVKPTAPDTGFGYIKQGAVLKGLDGVYAVDAFTEKPELDTARQFLADGNYNWNSGIFLFGVETFLNEARKHCAEMVRACESSIEKASHDLDFLRLDAASFEASPSDSIDYAVMEKTDKAATLPVDMGWNDVGSWHALWDIGEKDNAGNVTHGDVMPVETSHSYLRSDDSLVVTLGVENVVVVQTSDVVFVADRGRVHDVKGIVEELRKSGRSEHESHKKVFRPWGYYESLDDGDRHQVKQLYVKPGATLSLQKHAKRAEHWVVVEGTARVTLGDKTFDLEENQSTYIPIGTMHRLENATEVPLRIIEVQSGSYLGEDDIERFEDIYGRSKE